jgi:hypothetical protein
MGCWMGCWDDDTNLVNPSDEMDHSLIHDDDQP